MFRFPPPRKPELFLFILALGVRMRLYGPMYTWDDGSIMGFACWEPQVLRKANG